MSNGHSIMDRQEVLVAILLVCCAAFITRTSATSKQDKDSDASTTAQPESQSLPDDSRYADRFADGYMSGAWERTDNGWVHGGYTLVSGGESGGSGGAPVRTDVQYEVDPLGEMRVIARLPGQPQLQRSAFRIGLQPRRLPIYERMHHFHVGGDDGPHFDDDLDDDLDDDDDDFFDEPNDWGFSDEWASSTKVRAQSSAGSGADQLAPRPRPGSGGSRAGSSEPSGRRSSSIQQAPLTGRRHHRRRLR